jgi:glycosyltransferase involved in cell wall biosynthesis
MRLGLVLEQALAPVPGGTGRYTRELARALVASAGRSDSVHGWVARHRDLTAALVDGIPGPTPLALPASLLARLWRYGLPPRISDVDVLHAPTPLCPPSPAPTVVTVHDTVPWTHPQTLTRHGARWHRDIVARAVRRGAVVAVPSAAVAAELGLIFPEHSHDRLHVLGGGVPPDLLAEPAREAELLVDRRGLPERYLFSLATLEPRKGLDVLITALAMLGGAAPCLVIAGQAGWGGVDPAQAARRSGLPADRVLTLGRVSDQELAVLLRRARALVMPSRAEGFGLPVAEAMALGVPVICTDVPALVEVAGGAALVVPREDADSLADAIRAISTDDVIASALAVAGRKQAARHTWAAVAERAWDLYRSLV